MTCTRIILMPLLLISSCVFFIISVSAEEQGEIEVPLYVYEFPYISPELSGFLGLRYVDYTGSEKAAEYQYLHSSLSGGVKFIAFPFPHRLHIEIDALNKKDFFGDIRYAYKDIILLRDVTRGLYHNLDNIELRDPGPSNQYTIDRRDIDERYGVSGYSTGLYVRAKTPDYPFHIFFDGHFLRKYGSQQARFLSSYMPSNRVSMKRDVDWRSEIFTLGTNTHFGPVEIEYSHKENRFSVHGDRLLENTYNSSLYPLSLIPETEGSSNILKIHSSYTGMIVASLTFSDQNLKNLDSNAKREEKSVAGDLSIMLTTDIVLYLKYRHKDVNNDTPDAIPVNYLGYGSYTTPLSVKPSIDFKTDSLSSILRYRPLNSVTLTGEFTAEKTMRDNADYWNMPESTGKNRASITCNMRLFKGLNIKTIYTYQEIDAPSYNTQPDTSDEVRINASWMPYQWLNTLVGYSIIKEKRDRLQYYDNGVRVDVTDRDTLREKFFTSVSFPVSEGFTISPGFAYMRNRIVQDMVYDSDNISIQYHIDSGVVSRDISKTYYLNLDYTLMKNMLINIDISHTLSSGNLYHGGLIQDGLSISDVEGSIRIRETEFSIRSEYEFKKDFKAGVRYTYMDYDDKINGSSSSKVNLILVTLSKGW